MLYQSLRKMPWLVRASCAVLCIYAFVAIFAPVIAPYGETETVGTAFEPWSSTNWLGTDSIGRDMLSRLIYGTRNMVFLATGINVISFLIGGLFGTLMALKGGWLDQILGRLVDAMMAIPQLILALLLITALGNSISVLVTIIVILDSTRVIRLTRALSMNIVATEYIEAARLRGEGIWWCIWHEVLPNIRTPLVAEFGIRFCYVFLFISSLSFLGIGLQPPLADWGSMVRESSTLITFGDFTPIMPALAIAILTVSVNFIGDWVLNRNAKTHI